MLSFKRVKLRLNQEAQIPGLCWSQPHLASSTSAHAPVLDLLPHRLLEYFPTFARPRGSRVSRLTCKTIRPFAGHPSRAPASSGTNARPAAQLGINPLCAAPPTPSIAARQLILGLINTFQRN